MQEYIVQIPSLSSFEGGQKYYKSEDEDDLDDLQSKDDYGLEDEGEDKS